MLLMNVELMLLGNVVGSWFPLLIIISFDRQKIKTFAQNKSSAVRLPNNKIIPPLKLIILDESDSMTNAAQSALRRTMEKESKTTRFCFICNYVSRIIEPIVSRCSIFRFKPLSEELLKGKLKEISVSENIHVSDDVFRELVELSEGDLRRAITLLQSISNFKGQDELIKVDDVLELAGVIPSMHLNEFIELCKAQKYERLSKCVYRFTLEGYAANQFVLQIHEIILSANFLNDKQKSLISEHLALVDKRLLDGADEFLEMLDVGSIIMQALLNHTIS